MERVYGYGIWGDSLGLLFHWQRNFLGGEREFSFDMCVHSGGLQMRIDS